MGGMSIGSGRRIMRRGEERERVKRKEEEEARSSNAARKRRMQHVRTRGTTVGDISTQTITKLNKEIISQHTSTQALNKLLKQNKGPICVPPYCTVLPGVSAMP
ncbi:hypothetical protein FOIG_03435 [Fusarium odoratissimum NRRL 54006]|uniref:Uncharacterized protein n=1 Tax=Fusarium odoratissimum (strain NRRL 54006) TaxID=1089451 RepID=X0KDD6_FUSO5|nr:uncharacterized protein FOIG_03435 [Fusarium odoratissimum NRRL 54006]EXM06732.1 hypothetical protein FOIG_03435 [Fusarium odoratissimum NRRL 54006]